MIVSLNTGALREYHEHNFRAVTSAHDYILVLFYNGGGVRTYFVITVSAVIFNIIGVKMKGL